IAVRAGALTPADARAAADCGRQQLLLGSAVAGVVIEVGPGVRGLAAGDRVLGLAPGGIGPVAVTRAGLLAVVPPGCPFTAAAAEVRSCLDEARDTGTPEEVVARA